MPRRVWALTFFCLTTVFFVLPNFTQASSGIVIEAYRAAGTKSTDEYVELYNPTGSTITITGWQLAKKTASGTKYNLVTTFPAAQINPGESLIVGHKDSVVAPDISYTTDYSISEDNTIILFSDAGKTVVDRVGFGKAGDFEGAPAPAAGTDLWSRTAGVDTENNLADFKKATVGASDYSGICLSEIMPSPAEGEEWIEIYNSEMAKDIGGLVVADKSGAVKQFKVPAGTIIAENSYSVFYKKDTGITLNDDGDAVVLIDATGKVFDESANFGKATKGSSFAFDSSSWRWTTIPTPGAANKISSTEAAMISSKKISAASTSDPTASQKGSVPDAEVLGATSGASDIFKNQGKPLSKADQYFGLFLIGVALAGGLGYTGYVNRERLNAVFIEERKRYKGAWERLRSKMPRR